MMGETFTSRRRVASCRTSIGIVFVVYGWVLEFGFRSFAARRGNSEGRDQGGCAVILTSVPHHDRSRRLWRRLVQDPGALRAHSGEQKSHDRSGRESQSPGDNGGSAHNCFCFFHNETPPPPTQFVKERVPYTMRRRECVVQKLRRDLSRRARFVQSPRDAVLRAYWLCAATPDYCVDTLDYFRLFVCRVTTGVAKINTYTSYISVAL